MTKSETREVAKLNAIMLMSADKRPVGIDYLARSFSALIRSTMTKKSRNELINAASYVPAVVQHPDFIV
jgi:hypothetical protein